MDFCNQYLSMGQSNLNPDFVIGGLQGQWYYFQQSLLMETTTPIPAVMFTIHMTCDYTNAYNVYTSYGGLGIQSIQQVAANLLTSHQIFIHPVMANSS